MTVRRKAIWTRLKDIKYPYAPGLVRLLNRTRPDVIYQRCAMSLTGAAAWYSKKNGCPFFFHIASDRDVQAPGSFCRHPVEIPEMAMARYGIRQAGAIIAQTNQQAAMLKKNYGRKGIVIPNGHPVPKSCNKDRRKPLVLWIGNWKQVKQPQLFIRLAKNLRQFPRLRIVMAGRTEGWESLAAQARGLGIEVIGEVSNRRINDLLEEAHLLINTSKYEGFSNTFIQAWMRKVPVASLQVDPDNFIRDKGFGYCSGTYAQLLSDTMRLLKNHDLREKMGEASRFYAMNHFSLDNFDRILALMAHAAN